MVCGREEEGMLEPAGAGDYGKNGGSSVGRLTDVAAIRGDEDSAHFLTQVPLLRRSSGRCKWNRFSLFCRDESSRRRASGNSRFFLPRSPLPSRAPVNGFRTLFSSRIFFLEKSVLRTLFPSSFLSVIFAAWISRWLVLLASFFHSLSLSLLILEIKIPLGIFEGIFSFRFPRSTSLFSRASCCSSFVMNQSSRQIPDDWSKIERTLGEEGHDLLILSLFRNVPGWIESGDDVESRKRVERKSKHQKFHADRWFPLCERNTWYTRDTRPVYFQGGRKLAR